MKIISAKDLGIDLDYKVSGYYLCDWMADLKGKLKDIEKKEEEKKLKNMEKKLDELLSADKRTELEISEIEKLL